MRKVLIITYYWPPAGGPGVQRWIKFTKYMPEFGLEPIVFIPEKANYPLLDNSLLDEVPNNLQIVRFPIFEPYRLASFFSKKKTKRISSGIIQKGEKQSVLEKILLWVRGNLFIPDARKYWVKPAVRFLRQFIETHGIHTVITTGPPHSVHLIGMHLQKQSDIQWIADFRDPWTTIGYHQKLKLTSVSKKKHLALESKVLQRADKLIVTSNTTKKEFEQKTNTPIRCITNGFDGTRPSTACDSLFTLSHIGSLLTDRNPMGLWSVLGELIKENALFSERLRIQLIGVVGEEVLESLDAHGLSGHVVALGYLPHDAVVAYQTKSQVLLLTEIDAKETQGIIPGKLFEYLKAERPVLALGPEHWEAGELVEKSQSGRYMQVNDVKTIKLVVLDWFEQYKNQKLTVATKGVEKYHRRELTQSLADFITWESS
ncbi:MAG: glycosyl transferase family 1 [Allomuricauda sp.]|nr:MAG: glycosyl transferase family 1 [Allomuricauda sp.]